MLRLQFPHDLCGTIRRIIIYHQDMKTLLKGKNRTDNSGDIFLLIVGWYDDNFFQASDKLISTNLLFFVVPGTAADRLQSFSPSLTPYDGKFL